jgi:hypothetical protein
MQMRNICVGVVTDRHIPMFGVSTQITNLILKIVCFILGPKIGLLDALDLKPINI